LSKSLNSTPLSVDADGEEVYRIAAIEAARAHNLLNTVVVSMERRE
jgi:hypothetical protein